MKRLRVVAAVVGLWGAALTGTGRAGPITYTDQFVASGQLGNTAFGNALVTLTFTGDTSTIFTNGILFTNATPTATVNVQGVGTATFTQAMGVEDNQLLQGFEFFRISSVTELLLLAGPPFNTFDLQSSVEPVSPFSSIQSNQFGTTAGTFELATANDISSTFTATAAPEPASLTLLGIGVAGLLGYGWRRKRAPVAA
jgi:hypothetical protein